MELEALFRRFGLDYHYTHLSEAMAACGPVKGKRVLEIGGCLPREIVIERLGAAQWIGIDLPDYWEESGDTNPSSTAAMERKPLRGSTWQEETDHLCLLGDVTRLPASFGGRFDLVFSTSAFEHICDLPAAMSVAARALKSGGHFFAVAMRLWLSSTGHHLPPVYHDGKRVDVGSDILLPWMHLYLTPEEMEERLAGRLPNDVVQQIVHHIYLSAHINRAMPEEYERAFMAADFSGRTIHRIYEAPTPPDIQERLEGLFGPGRFDQWGVRIIGEK